MPRKKRMTEGERVLQEALTELEEKIEKIYQQRTELQVQADVLHQIREGLTRRLVQVQQRGTPR